MLACSKPGMHFTYCRYLEKREYEQAYTVACLGVTEADWRQLALEALQVGVPSSFLVCCPAGTRTWSMATALPCCLCLVASAVLPLPRRHCRAAFASSPRQSGITC